MTGETDFDRLYRLAFDAPDKAAFLEQAFKAGNKAAPLLMFMLADIYFGLRIPEWASKALRDACAAAARGEISSWDEAFGNPVPRGKQARSLKTAARKFEIWYRIKELSDDGLPIGDALFERVGRELGVGGKTTVEKLYSEARDELEAKRREDVRRYLEEAGFKFSAKSEHP